MVFLPGNKVVKYCEKFQQKQNVEICKSCKVTMLLKVKQTYSIKLSSTEVQGFVDDLFFNQHKLPGLKEQSR